MVCAYLFRVYEENDDRLKSKFLEMIVDIKYCAASQLGSVQPNRESPRGASAGILDKIIIA